MFGFSRAAKLKVIALAATTLALTSTSALAHDVGASAARLGKVSFKVECNAEAQKGFNLAMALYYSFAWQSMRGALDAVAKADPDCGMVHWARAMGMLDNPFVWPANLPAQRLKEIAVTLSAAKPESLKSQREKDYVAAVAVFVQDGDKVDHRTRLQAFDDAMSKLAGRYSDDKEASILSALVTSANFNPTDKTYANQLKAAAVLEPLFKANPEHPGIAHYLIHSYDYPPIAKKGLDAAKRYAAIAPDAPHALHMPSHIFTRVGYWRESIAANKASAKAADAAVFDGHHAHDYMVYAHLQLAQDRAAKKSLGQSRAKPPVDHFAAAYAYAAMPARIALERGDWKQAASLSLHPAADAYAWKKYPQAESVNAFARGVGAARSADAAAAKVEQIRLLSLRDAAKEMKLGYWADQIDIQAALVGALAQCAAGARQTCIDELRLAAGREDATEKHVVTPGPLVPARELLAEMLLEDGKAAEALKEYQQVLMKEPHRYRAVVGVMRAARKAGEQTTARNAAVELRKQASNADTGRPTMREAMALVAAR